MRGAIDLGALAQSRKAQSVASDALANAPAGVVVDVNEVDFQQKVWICSKRAILCKLISKHLILFY
jgi:hypothetical protein